MASGDRSRLPEVAVREGVGAESGVEEASFDVLLCLAAGYQFREDGVVDHLRRVARSTGLIGEALGLGAGEVARLRGAALFHDVGMVDVPEAILRKEGRLSDEESALMRRHPELGSALLRAHGDSALLVDAAEVAGAHHERFDGSGYPRGLRGEAIPRSARIVALVDVFDALVSRRSFKEAYPFDVATEILRAGAGSQFDPAVVEAFLSRLEAFRELVARFDASPRPSLAGFRVSARDGDAGDVFHIARSAYFSCPFCGELHVQDTERCPTTRNAVRLIHKLSGRVIDGKYAVGAARGVGGMGTVYEARHLRIGRRVAVKFLDADLARDEGNLARFYNEARVHATVGHPNLVEVTDVGRTPEGIPFMVMELIEGVSLARWLWDAGGAVAPIAAITLALEVLRTLEAVHAVGIVHRDLKPDNIFLHGDADEPRVKILDFGVSLLQVVDDEGRRLTRAGDVFGTPQYMSPEQAQGRLEVDGRSDLFTLGAILYEMVSGRPAFRGDNALAIIRAVTWGECDVPASAVPGIAPRLAAAIERALQPQPGDRYPSAAAFAADLEPLAREDERWRPGRVVGLDDRSAAGSADESPAAADLAAVPAIASGTRRWFGGPPRTGGSG